MKNSDLIPDYRDLLRAEYDRLQQERDYDFRLKDFAKMIGVSRPFLSQLFGHRAHLSPEKAASVAEALGWLKGKKRYLLDLVEVSAPRFKSRNESALRRLELRHLKFRALNESVLDQITWRHSVLLQLIQIHQPNGTPSHFEKRAGLEGQELRAALAVLERLNLARQHNGKWSCVDTEQEVVMFNSTKAVREYHTQFLRQAVENLTGADPRQRQFETFVMAFDRSFMEEARQAIRKFQSEFYAKFNRGKADAAYCLGTQFFRVDTHPKEKA